MKPGLQLRLHQQLALTPQLQQAIRLLQLSQLELETELRQMVESNPMLEFADEAGDGAAAGADGEAGPGERAEEAPAPAEASAESSENWDAEPEFALDPSYPGSGGNGDDDALEAQDAAPEGLREHLLWQLNLTPMSERDRAIATALIDALDEDGYLREGLEPVATALAPLFPVTMEEIEAVRHRVQRFDPVGVASLDLRDCLAVQLELMEPATEGRALAQQIVAGELELLAKQDLARLARRLHADDGDVAVAAALIRSLDPRPGAALNPAPVEYVTPDAYAWKADGRWRVSLSPGSQPRLAVNQHYCSLIARARREDAAYLRGQLQEARWLLKSLKARADTLLKVAEAIVRAQSAFLEYGPEAMKPLVLREVAEQVGMHESTISRVTTRKYLHTPRGTFEFKYFFSSGVSTDDGGSASATAIQAMIRKLVADENRRQPFSDQALAEELHRRGIQVARRTVAKYREALRIPSSSERMRAS
ncbi:RNA polymerase, sigma 54 subunit, RpoN/SigL [Mizugakiibacter sediminis]|uniref:RNA polymerase sigma-54 factor n=1 Tax=Mizugakiibacter sediminis TaxID=1475481 RepID=A0A0K8QP16_9GAMM|nr:RNA polymerase factor sigma-54 [Mizugakiibacter sediminis]GAP66471.1 RNA polymerase, sigma 54 subunit, RpoN/SigL [Mizugakiibacter sediminis]